jgi:hypothetical protein
MWVPFAVEIFGLSLYTARELTPSVLKRNEATKNDSVILVVIVVCYNHDVG